MKDLNLLSLTDLFDLLEEQTNHHPYLRVSGASHDQLIVSSKILKNLQAEIALRKLVETHNRSYFPSQNLLQHPGYG
jgi:hypothetical protein